jgi:GNAT superfamily N-acetyltransferase
MTYPGHRTFFREELKPAAIIAYAFVGGQASVFHLATSSKMMMRDQNSLTIRTAGSADAAGISSLAHQLLLHERALDEGMGELTRWAATAEELRKQMLRPNTRFFIAEKENETIGYIKVVIHGKRLTREEIGIVRYLIVEVERAARKAFNFLFRRPRQNIEAIGGYIAGIFVRPDDRRSGIGRLLIAAAEDWLRAQGIKTSELHVLHANEDARHFWEETGYKPLAMGMRKKL